jgi:hypothetical protein
MSDSNTKPDNFVELTEKEWAQSDWFTYSPEKTEFRQFAIDDLDGKSVYHNFRLYWMPCGHGYAITRDYWKGRVRVFRFGCNHKWKELSYQECKERNLYHGGSCYHVDECELCKQVKGRDSSD